ncbi:MAG: carbon monoxide dehydrogenase subunit G [Hydrogenophaga sp.]|uniref:CoxG family protein n=1 Tax=Hydrogenophaga sp. TaxID=1904254 RepID=UPI001D5695D7|nr:carbon monoxide dehydrogenase subunit G [Hydrogenophaga sp.]MBX3611934.1 carbon monoxide dehydrogenase subunit G [Hydrogenophaga sp.]
MDMQGSRPLPVTRQQAWDALNDPAVLKACVPGCDKFEPLGDDAYAVGAGIRIGPVSAKFTGKVQLSDIVPPERYKLGFEAQGGVAGFGKGESAVSLTPTGSTCELSYTVKSTVGGKIAQLGQRLIDGAAKSMADDFFKRFEEELLRRHPEAAATAAAAAPAPVPSGPWPVWVWASIAFLITFALGVIIFFSAAWG